MAKKAKPADDTAAAALFDAFAFVSTPVRSNLEWLAHYVITPGRVVSFDGQNTLSAPLPLDITACPQMDTFDRALGAARKTGAVGTDRGPPATLSRALFIVNRNQLIALAEQK